MERIGGSANAKSSSRPITRSRKESTCKNRQIEIRKFRTPEFFLLSPAPISSLRSLPFPPSFERVAI